MKVKELFDKLNNNIRIPKDAFAIIDGGYQFPSETYCLNMINEKFEYYYSERGIKTGLKEFDTENEACEYFYNKLLSVFDNKKK